MSSPDQVPRTPSEALPFLLPVLSQAVENGQSFPQLDIEVKKRLGAFGIYGSAAENVPSAATSWGAYRDQSKQDRVHEIVHDNSHEAMSDVREYNQAREDNTMGLTMALAYTGMQGARRHGVYVAYPQYKKERGGKKRLVDGVVSSLVTSYTFDDDRMFTLFHTMVQGMHNKSPAKHIVTPIAASQDWQRPENPWDLAWMPPKQTYVERTGVFVRTDEAPQTPRPHTVEVTQLNEYQRFITEAMSILIRDELKAIGIILPRQKVPLGEWLKVTTLHPEIKDWLQAIDDTYQKIHGVGFVLADYVEVNDPEGKRLKPSKKDHISALDPSARSKTERDEMNGRIHKLPNRGGDSRRNLEQDKRRRRRYTIERKVNLKRPRPPKKGEPYYGTPQSKPLNFLDRAIVEIQETFWEVKENPDRRMQILPELAGGIAGKALGGLVDIGLSALVLVGKGAVATWKGTKNYAGDFFGWKDHRREAREQLSAIHERLRKMQADINAGMQADQFPSTSLPPSKQIALIRRMTKMMREKLDYNGPDSAINPSPA